MNIRGMFRAVRDRLSSDRTPHSSSPIVESLEARVMLNADWTVMVYLDGDNNLESAAIDDINEMERVGSINNVNIVVQCDRIDGYDSTNGDWTDTRRGKIEKDGSTTQIGSTFTSIGEVNMGDRRSFLDFLVWGVETYTADNYAVILWDHGGGIDGVCWDETNGGANLSIDELGWAFKQLPDRLADPASFTGIDLIGFDACLMGMVEVAYEISPYADYMVASEDSEPNDGWAYDEFLATLCSTPNMPTTSLTEEIVSTYVNSYDPNKDGVSLSSIDLQTMTAPNDGLVDELDDFVIATLTNATTNDYDRMRGHWYNTTWFDPSADFNDLGMFLEFVADDMAMTTSIRTSAQDALSAYNQAVWYNETNYSGPTGMSIYFPDDGASSTYLRSRIDFVDDTPWDVFLDWFEDMHVSGLAGQVEGYVFEDVDCDGVEDAGETNLLAGWDVYLGNRTTQTDATGWYSFDSVPPGDYALNVVDNPSDGVWGTMSAQPVTVTIGQLFRAPALGGALAGEILGTVYERDLSGDTPGQGWTIYVDANDNHVRNDGEAFDVTDANGVYELLTLQPGVTHPVRAELKSGYRGEFPLEDEYSIPLSSDETSAGNDFIFKEWLYAVGQQLTVAEDPGAPLAGQLEGVDPRGYGFEFVLVDGPDHAGGVNGEFTFNSDGSFTYTPNENFNGEDSFSFICSNPLAPEPDYVSDPAYVVITVTPVNDAPEATETQISRNATEDVPLDLELSQYFHDEEADIAHPPDGSRYLTYELDPTNMPQYGRVTVVMDGDGQVTCTYLASRVFSDVQDVFEIRAVDRGDPHGTDADVKKSEYLRVTIDVESVNDTPVCVDQPMTMPYTGNPLEILLRGQDEETYSGALLYGLVSDPVYRSNGEEAGRVDVNGNRATYYFSEHRFQQDQNVQFTYSVTDPEGEMCEGTVYLTLTPPEGTYVTVGSGYTAQYRDEDGSLVRVRVNNGSTVLFFAGENISSSYGRRNTIEIMGGRTRLYDLQVSKANLRTSISVSARGGDGRATIGCIRGASVLGRFNGQCVDLVGHGVEMTGDGYIRNLYLNDVQGGADIRMEGAGAGMTMALGAIDTETDIFLGLEDIGQEIPPSYADLRSFSAISWAGGSLTANSVGTFRITGLRNQAGNLNADISLKSKGKALGRADVKGLITGGTWDIEGQMGTMAVGGSSPDWILKVKNTLGQIRSFGALGGKIAVGQPQSDEPKDEFLLIPDQKTTSIGSIFAGSLDGTTILAGGGIGSIRAQSWQNDLLNSNNDPVDSLNAAWLQVLRIDAARNNPASGMLGINMNLTGNYRGYSMFSASVAGQITGGEWNLTSSLKILSATGGTGGDWTAHIGGDVKLLNSRGTLDGNITIDGYAGLIRTLGTFAADMSVNGVNRWGLSINSFQVGRSVGGKLTAVNGGVGTIRAGEWLDGPGVQDLAEIRTAYINSLQIIGGRGLSGDLFTDIHLSGQNARGMALGFARIRGDWNGSVNKIGGDVGEIGPFYESGKLIPV